MAWIILGLLIAGLAWLLLAPIRLDVDSDRGLLRLQWWGIAQGQLAWIDGEPVAKVYVFFWTKHFYLLRPRKKPTKESLPKAPAKPSKKKASRWTWSKMRSKVWRLLRSFRLRFLYVNFDSDDYVRNAYLYPLFHAMSKPKRQLKINFQGVKTFRLRIENRLVHILYALLF